MADFPALPLWTDAYLSDTRHLSTVEHGAYLLLLMEAWRRPSCSLPDDDKMLCRLVGLPLDEWLSIKEMVLSFWVKSRNEWVQKRLKKERQYLVDKSSLQRRRVLGRWNKTENDDTKNVPKANRENTPTPTPTPTIKKEPSAPKKGTRIDPNYQPPREWSLAQGLDIAILESQLQQFKNYWLAKAGADAVKIDWDRTWQNWILKYLERNGLQKTAPRNVGELIDQRMKGQGNAEPAINGQSRLLLEGDNSGLSKGPSFLEELAREAKRRSGL